MRAGRLQGHGRVEFREPQAGRGVGHVAARAGAARGADPRCDQPPRRARSRERPRLAPCRRGKLSVRKHINAALARDYAAEFARLGKQLKISGEVTLDQVLRAPGVFQTDEELAGTEDLWPAVEKALNHALASLVKMREREGAHLAKDLTARTGVMRAAVEKVQKQAPTTAENYRQNLLERIKSAGIENIAPDDERLLKEIVLF